LEVFVDGHRIGKAEFGAARDDIAKAHPDYPNSRFSGFSLKADAGEFGTGRKTVMVTATARSGIVADAVRQVEAPRRRASRKAAKPAAGLRHHCDALNLTTD